jgi:uncharacterized protein
MEKQVKSETISTVERRFFQSEARAKKSESGELRIGGYGAIFNKYTNMGWYAEVVMPGFFDEIKSDRCACLLNHDANQVLGRKANNTLELKTDANGLEYEAKLPSSRADVHELIQEGYIYESSFAFTTLKTTWEEVDRSLLAGMLSEADLDQLSYGGKVSVRKLEKGKELFDVSPVTFAAYEGTTTDTRVAKRSFEVWKAEEQHSAPPPEQAPNYRRLIFEAKMRSAT